MISLDWMVVLRQRANGMHASRPMLHRMTYRPAKQQRMSVGLAGGDRKAMLLTWSTVQDSGRMEVAATIATKGV